MKRAFYIWIAIFTLVFCGTLGMVLAPVAHGVVDEDGVIDAEWLNRMHELANRPSLFYVDLDEFDMEKEIAYYFKLRRS